MTKKAAQKRGRAVLTGNWKMHKTVKESLAFVKELAPLLSKKSAQVELAVPYTVMYPLSLLIKELKVPITLGAQNMNDYDEGAFTGEVSAKMLKDVGAKFVVLGHSERRHLFHESSQFVNRKVKKALEHGLAVTVCVGESLKERKAGRVEEVLTAELTESLKGVAPESMSYVSIAYEPIWAIGTGRVAHPEDAQEVHALCRHLVEKEYGTEIASSVVLQYGGSAKPENAAKLLSEKDIDGLLVGGASLNAKGFAQMINSGESV